MNLTELRREIDWRIQNRLAWSAPVLKRRLRDVTRVLAGLRAAQAQRYRALAGRYDLADWPRVCTARDYRLNLYVLDVLDRYLPRPAAGGRCLDIGAAAWGYLPALAAWSGGAWDGVELDAHRRYWTLATRAGHARYMCRHFPGCRYRVGSLLDLRGFYAAVTWFLPFVRPAPLAAARLPARFFQPQALLAHALSLLAPNACLFIVNQGEDEAEIQSALLTALGAKATELGEITSEFSPFTRPRYGWLVPA
ncbi:MAG: hypothetical protein NHB36_00235 [Nitrospira sp.]|nr:hypothetical protein [Nitrospira sp.]